MQKKVNSKLKASLHFPVIAVTGNDNDTIWVIRLNINFFEEFETIQLGHAQIKQYQIRLFLF